MSMRLPGNQEEPQLRQEGEESIRLMSGRIVKHARPHREGKSGSKALPPQQEVRPTSRNGGIPGKVSHSYARPPTTNRQLGKAGRSDLEKTVPQSSSTKRPGSANSSPPSSNNPANPRKPNVTYNLYINVCDDKWKHFDPGLMKESSWEENVMCSGLAKACTVFRNIKSGRIHVSKLRPALHTLEVLVTSDEMYQTLKSITVDGM
ncbi:hypothetical protein JD844_002234 [Phrynosoma platyrhinos]|uniref:Uncharacterized protein n=1 Tax=Phrynosoma platyrhinos TaxID=52577 RepID=A0ABQ7TBX6_PHRPL|nr:hypothetical protein JD844_002234 [Phrynosoma platyrhinos]